MSNPVAREPLAPQVAVRLTDFARACKAATRAVSLYPDGHPAIVASLNRLVDVAQRAVVEGPLVVTVEPAGLLIDRRAPARPDAAIGELAALLHEHLVGEMTVQSAADADAWKQFLHLVAAQPAEVQARGGIARVWVASGGQHVQVREVDYAEVLRERDAGIAARWDAIIDHCLQGNAVDLDEDTWKVLLDIAGDADRLADLTAQVTERSAGGGVRLQTDALLRLFKQVIAGAMRHSPERIDEFLANMSGAASRLTPDAMLEIMKHRYEATEGINVVDAMVTRMTDSSLSIFVARNVIEQRDATARLVEAFQALVPEQERRQRLVAMAQEEVQASPLGAESTFPELWKRASEMLTSYSDEPFVSKDYAGELSTARGHAADVERIADDRPERVAEWLATVSDASIRGFDLQLLLDLLRIEEEGPRYAEIVEPVAAHVDDLVLLGDFEAAAPLVRALSAESGKNGRATHRPAAAAALDRLMRGHLMPHLIGHLRTLDDDGVAYARDLVTALGPATIRPLAEALATEERGRAVRRLSEILVSFGKAARDAAEPLRTSPNPAVRRTAIHLLRAGGNDALGALAEFIDDPEATVQREAVRALAIIGTPDAYATLQKVLTSGSDRQREAIMAALGSMRDERAVPLFCHMVGNDAYRKSLRSAWLAAVDGLAATGGADAIAALREALQRGEWWAPRRTAALRKAVATALRRIGSPEAVRALETAAEHGSSGARAAAREQLAQIRSAPPKSARRR